MIQMVLIILLLMSEFCYEKKQVTSHLNNILAHFLICRHINDNFSDLVAFLSAKRSPPGTNETDKQPFELVIIQTYLNESDNPSIAEVLGKEIK